MNVVVLTGRLTKDPELKYTIDNKPYVRFTLAVNRNYKNENGDTDADFINCFAWGNRAEAIAKYVKKGNQFSISGSIRTSSYEKDDGTRGYLTEIQVATMQFIEKKDTSIPEPVREYGDNVQITEQESSSINEVKEDPFANFGQQIELTDEDLPF